MSLSHDINAFFTATHAKCEINVQICFLAGSLSPGLLYASAINLGLHDWVLLLLATVGCSGRPEAEQHAVRVAAEHRGNLGAEQCENQQPARTRRGRTEEQSRRVWGATQRTQQRNRRLPPQRGLSGGILLQQLLYIVPAAKGSIRTECRHASDYLNPAVRTHYLHWLPVRRRVEFKLACLVHQSLAKQTLSYLASDIQLTADTSRPQLRSVSETIRVVPRTHNSFGDRSFSTAGPRVWNALPSHLRLDMNYRHFKHSLKGHMFKL